MSGKQSMNKLNSNREVENIYQTEYEMEVTELKNTITDLRSTLEGFNSGTHPTRAAKRKKNFRST